MLKSFVWYFLLMFPTLLRITFASAVHIFRLTAPLVNNLPPLCSLPLLLFLKLFSGLFPQKWLHNIGQKLQEAVYTLQKSHPQFLLPLWGHEPLLCLLACSLSLKPGPDFSFLPVDLCLLPAKMLGNLCKSNFLCILISTIVPSSLSILIKSIIHIFIMSFKFTP